MLANEHERLFKSFSWEDHVLIRCVKKLVVTGFSGLKYIDLGFEQIYWLSLPKEARDLAKEVGAVKWRSDDVWCPVFEDEGDLVLWFVLAYRKGLIPKKIIKSIKSIRWFI